MLEMPAAELAGWLAYEEQEPTGWRPDWWPFAALMAWQSATHPFGPKAYPPAVFMPGAAAKAEPDTPEERVAKVRAGGGRVIEPPPLIRKKPKGN